MTHSKIASVSTKVSVTWTFFSQRVCKRWKKLTVKNGKVTAENPKAVKGVSFKALVVDKKGSTLSQTIIDAIAPSRPGSTR